MHLHRSVVLNKIYPLCHGESFDPSLLPFLFVWWMKRWEIAVEVSMNRMAYTYYFTLMAKCTYAWLHHSLIKIINKCNVFPCSYWFKSTRIISCWDLHACSWAVVCQYSCCWISQEDRLVEHFWFTSLTTMNCIIFYAWTNRLAHFSTYILPIPLLLCVNIKCLIPNIIKYVSGQYLVPVLASFYYIDIPGIIVWTVIIACKASSTI